MNGKEYSLSNDDQLEAVRDHARRVLADDSVTMGEAAIVGALLYVGDCLRKGFDLLARSRP